MQFKITTDGKLITKMLGDVQKRSGELKGDVHILACSVIAKAIKDGDATQATHMPDALTEALGEAWRLNALRQWFEAFGPFKWHAKDGDKPAGFKIDKDRRKAMVKDMDDLGEAEYLDKLVTVKTYWEFKPESEFKPFDLVAMLGRIVSEAKKKAADDKRKAIGKDDLTGLTEVAELYAKLSEKTAAKVKKAKAA